MFYSTFLCILPSGNDKTVQQVSTKTTRHKYLILNRR